MNTIEISDLELQIDNLIRAMERMKTENQSLRHKLSNSSQERARLQDKNKRASIQIKQVIRQLKEELK